MPDDERAVDWVVLDLGETLVDETANWARWATFLEVPLFTFAAVVGALIAERGRSHVEALEHFRPGAGPAELEAAKTAAGLGWRIDAADLYPDALPALSALRTAGYRVAVMANQPVESVGFMAGLPVDRYAASAQWDVAKPDPAFFARVATELDIAPDRIAYVGDRVDNDIVPAKAAGMSAIHVRRGPWGHLQAGWPEAAEADARVSSLLDLPAVLASLGRSDRHTRPRPSPTAPGAVDRSDAR